MKRTGAVTAAAVALGCVALAGAGCATKPGGASLPVDAPGKFSRSGASATPDQWWTTFGDARLDALVDEALRSNLDLKSAWQRLRAARAVVDREAGARYPSVDASAEARVGYPDLEDSDTLWLGLTAQYEVDLWGRIGSTVEAARYRARASLADYRTVALSLSAEVTRTWYRLIEARGQVELLRSQVEANEQVLQLLKNRFGSGQVRAVDILRQEQLVEATRDQKLAAEAELEVTRHQLAVLLGRPPRRGVRAAGALLPALPPLPNTGVPSELVRRRPDVQSSYNLLLAADRDMAAAIAAQYPRLSFSTTVGTSGSSASEVFEGWFASLAANLLAPLFDGGRRRAEVARTRAVVRERLYDYGQTTLIAFREVEDALVQEHKQVERITSLERQAELARQTYERLRGQYFYGLSNYIDVLTALAEEQQLQRELLAARRVLLELRIALYRALAGGFDTPRDSE